MKNSVILLKALLLSTSRKNIYRHTTDRKKRRKIISNTIGMLCLYLMLVVYCIAMCAGYGTYGMIEAIPATCALTISILAFLFTFFKTNGYLFHFREYDMLMSLPFEARTIAGCKFLYMYIESLPWYGCISIAMLIGYGLYAHPPVSVYPLWLILSLFLPVIPMLAAAFAGFLIAKISSGFRKTTLIQTILTFLFVIFCFSLRFIIDDLFRNEKIQATLESSSEITSKAAGIYLPAAWFAAAVTRHDILSACLLIFASVFLFAGIFYVIGIFYRGINSALNAHAAAKEYTLSSQRQHSPVVAIALKEWKRMSGSTSYLVNCALGEILSAILGIATILIGFDRIIAVVTNGAPLDTSMLQPAIPFIIYFFIGMIATTVCSPSLEGKNYWIIRSLPIEMKTVYQGKMLFNMVLSVPFMAFSTLCLCISAKVPAVNTFMYLVLGFALCAFSTSWGCVCGIRHMRLDWENEIEVIKQSSAVAIYMLPNMFIVMGLTVLVVFLGLRISHILLAAAFTLTAALLALLSYLTVMRLAKRKSP